MEYEEEEEDEERGFFQEVMEDSDRKDEGQMGAVLMMKLLPH